MVSEGCLDDKIVLWINSQQTSGFVYFRLAMTCLARDAGKWLSLDTTTLMEETLPEPMPSTKWKTQGLEVLLSKFGSKVANKNKMNKSFDCVRCHHS